MDIIADHGNMPDMTSIANYISETARPLWLALVTHIEAAYRAKPQIAFSTCAAKPGWNVKYKKGGKALCTLYPEKEGFTALVVLGAADIMHFEAMRPTYTDSVNALYDSTRLFNNTRWLMISVTDQTVLGDIKKLLALKAAKA